MSSHPYPNVDSNPHLPELEAQVLDFWQSAKTFELSVSSRPEQRADGQTNAFVFYDGPPFANGLPHYGHLLTGYKKDMVARYQTQKGHKVERRFGWDCHGLPAEMGAEKELGISGRRKIMEYGVNKFNAHCRESVMRYRSEWQRYVNRQARWVDFENDYKTMDTPYMESVMWAFKQLFDKGLVYEAMRVMPYSWACETPLSNFETRMDDCYRSRADKAVTVGFTLNVAPKGAPEADRYQILAWTTTPWTLPSNLALAVHPKINYACVVRDGSCYIIAQSSVGLYLKEFGFEAVPEGLTVIPGSALLGLTYQPLFPYFKDHQGAFRVLAGDFVEEGSGTGIVHMAPGFGEEDQVLCQKEGIALVCPVDDAGKFTEEVSDFTGLQVFDANDPIIIMLKGQGAWFKTEQYIHDYPHCWRTDTPLIYKAVPSWYVEVTKFKDRMVELNQNINWVPGHIKDGLFGKWLENARDWSISRNRFWGTPIPVWRSDNPAYPRIDVYGSVAELERDFGVKVADLHKPYIDDLVRPNPDDPSGKSMMRRIPDVFDCWFESGSMPYAQVHYPFENKEWFERHFPADFIAEYVAQTRGWFYTLMVLSTALFDREPFKNCVCHGVVLDEKGQKLSKRLQNYADPMEIFATHGSDALRWLVLSSSVMRGNDLLIDKDGRMVRDVVRLSLKPIWNAYHFFTLYANADGIQALWSVDSQSEMDRYLLAKLRHAVGIVTEYMDKYDSMGACQAIEQFFEILNNWYIRRSRVRFWKSEKDSDKQHAYNTLFVALHTMMRLAAPLAPMLTETIFAGLVAKGQFDNKTSVHLQDYPLAEAYPDAPELVAMMDQVRAVCNAALAVRSRENIRVRQPLASLTVIGKHLDGLQPCLGLIADEVNVKEVQLSEALEAHADLVLQLQFKLLGKRLPEKVKTLIAAVKQGDWQRKENGVVVAGEALLAEEYELVLTARDPKASEALASQDALILLDLQVTQALHAEGIARDVVRVIQQARKGADLNISSVVPVTLVASSLLVQMLAPFTAYIEEQTLSRLALSESRASAKNALFTATETLEEGVVEVHIETTG
jgi:isoleucyl-tRNA synthetase